MADVFLSYSRVDTVKAMIVKESLEALGLEVFFDVEGLDSGDVFPDVLDREVKAAGAVLAVWSSISINRPWVKKECGIAMERGVLVPVQIEPISLMDKPTAFSDLQYQDLEQFVGEPDHIGWERTVRALAKTLKRPDLIKTRKKQVVDKERAQKLEAKLKEKDVEMLRLKSEGGGYRLKLWHGLTGLVALALLIGGAVWIATSMQAASFERQIEDLLASNKLDRFDDQASNASEELAKILENVSIEALERKAGTDGRAALLLGWAYNHAIGVEQDFVMAVEFLGRSCELGSFRGCANLGSMFRQGNGVAKNYTEAARLYRQACEGGDMSGCSLYWFMYDAGQLPELDPVEVVWLYRRLCEGDEMIGCTTLGMLFENGEGVKQDPEAAARYYRRACAGRDMYGCEYLGSMYQAGEGVVQNSSRAVRLYYQACEGNNISGCAKLGKMYEIGDGVQQDVAESKRLYQHACNWGYESVCSLVK